MLLRTVSQHKASIKQLEGELEECKPRVQKAHNSLNHKGVDSGKRGERGAGDLQRDGTSSESIYLCSLHV